MTPITGFDRKRIAPGRSGVLVVAVLVPLMLCNMHCLWDRGSDHDESEFADQAMLEQIIGESAPGVEGAITSDTLRERLVFVSGSPFQTWEWYDQHWERIHTSTTPPGMGWFELCFFQARGLVMLLGNPVNESPGQQPAPQLWSFDGQEWRRESMLDGPVMGGGKLVHDSVHQRLLYTGECLQGWSISDSGNCHRQDFRVWSFDGVIWTILYDNQALDLPYYHISLVHDADRDCLVLCGVHTVGDYYHRYQTWEYHATGWVQTSSDSGVICPLVHDRKNGTILGILGVDTETSPDITTVYRYLGSTWEQVGKTYGFAATGTATYHDPEQAIYTCRASELMRYSTTAGWDNARPRTTPAPFADGLATWSTSMGAVVFLIRSSFYDTRFETWSWDGKNFTLLDDASHPYSHYSDGCLVEDPIQRRLLSFHLRWNAVESVFEMGTYAFEGGEWRIIDVPPPLPIDLYYADAVAMSGNGSILVVGYNTLTGSTPWMETWEFRDDRWTQLTSSAIQPLRTKFTLVYDEAQDRGILYGGLAHDNYCLNDTWFFDGLTWSEITQNQAPLFRDSASATYVGEIGRVALIGGHCHGSLYRDAWVMNAGNWQRLACSGPEFQRYGAATAYDPVRRVMVIAGGTNGPENFNSVLELGFP